MLNVCRYLKGEAMFIQKNVTPKGCEKLKKENRLKRCGRFITKKDTVYGYAGR